MQIGKTIRKYRKENGLTQEEINTLVLEADTRLKTQSYEEVFLWAKSKLGLYPNCLMLIWQLVTILDAQRLFKPVADASAYDEYILSCYDRVLQSEDESLRIQAADCLFSYYLRNEQYEKAGKYLTYYSQQNPQRRLKQALLYSKTGRMDEAYKTSEELLFSGYQTLNMTLQNLYLLSMKERDFRKAHLFTDKQQELAKLFEMGKYNEAACKLELATVEKDVERLLDIMETMLDSAESISDFSKSELYAHMNFQNTGTAFLADLKKDLQNCFRDPEAYGFLADNERWKRLVQQ